MLCKTSNTTSNYINEQKVELLSQTMDEGEIALLKIEKAKAFWRNVDVDNVFEMLLQYLVHLRELIKGNTASDKEYVQGMNVLQDLEMKDKLNMKHYAIEEVVIGEELLTKSDLGCSQLTFKESRQQLEDILPEQNISYDDSRELEPVVLDHRDPLTPLSPHQDMFDLVLLSPSPYNIENALGHFCSSQSMFEPHDCSPACLAVLPPHPDHFLGQNPLRAPLLCQFRRQCSSKTQFSTADDVAITTQITEEENEDVFYKTPCGRELHTFEEVMHYLRQTEAFGVLQPWNFSFHPLVRPELPPMMTTLSRRDMSRGIESVAVQLCNEVDSAQPTEFRYRRERWPHGCFLSAGELFSACCDCTDGCSDSRSCACLQLARKAAGGPVQFYTHQRLQQPAPTGLYECSPWCGCDPYHCLNRVVQHGVRVRLQVFRRCDQGWGVRCRDDLDVGTFVCTYAGVVLRTEQNSEESPVVKCAREEAVSDDEVEVVEEWTLPMTGSSATTTDPCSPSHIPVIQRPTDHTLPATDGDEDSVRREDQERILSVGKVAPVTVRGEEKTGIEEEPQLKEKDSRKRTGTQEEVWRSSNTKQNYYLDATKEGNVGRFIKHSCSPNLFVQNVFIDTHDLQFPVMAFFTSRTVKAGTELTWNYSHDVSSD